MSGHEDHSAQYKKIYFILLGLFAISVAGPFAAEFMPEGNGRLWLVLITAFGVAFIKAYLVAAKFMHLDIEKPIVHWFLATALAFMVLFFAAVAPDVMKNTGSNWVKSAEIEWHETSAAYRAKHGEGGHHGGSEGHGDEAKGDDHAKPEGDSHGEGDGH